MATRIDYLGSELELFSHAVNWKRYWSKAIAPYLGDTVIDVGAGIGATAQTLQTRHYDRWIEIEPDFAQAEKIRQLQVSGAIPKYYEVLNGVSADLPGTELFDTALYIDVLEHIQYDKGELKTVSKLMKAGGHIVILGPAHQYLYTEFDKQIGHFRRYDRAALEAIAPAGFEIVKMAYLDSVGMLASLANKLILKSGSPKVSQIKLWDRAMVPISRWLDPVTGYTVGKSILCVLRKSS